MSLWPVAFCLLGQNAPNGKPLPEFQGKKPNERVLGMPPSNPSTFAGAITLKAGQTLRLKVTSSKSEIKAEKGDDPVSCGGVPSYKNAKPKNYEDTRPTKYDKETKKHVPVVFNAGDKIEFKCEKG